jgi:signal transduction histidine kinase
MKLNIFWRLFIGYLVISMLGMMVGVYAINQLRKLNTATRHILNVDNRILESDKRLADLTLSQHKFLKKYTITQDRNLYEQFLSLKKTFQEELDKTLAISDGDAGKILERVANSQAQYHSLAGQEVEKILKRQGYSRQWYNQEEEKLIDQILKDLDKLEIQVRQNVRQRMKEQGETGDSAWMMAGYLALIAFILIIISSFLTTRGITRPLSLLRLKTREISEGIFKNDLVISSSPEIAELARAFNTMSQKLKELDKIKSDFFSTLSHELRTPLTSIKEGIALLEEETAGPVTGKQKKLLSIISQESKRLIDLVNSSLDLSKMEAGMMDYHLEKAPLTPLIEKVIQEMGPLIEVKKIRLWPEIKDPLPMVEMDQERILQALRNLVGNAVKVTPGGGFVSISAEPVKQGIRVAVKDTGPGIPEENLSNIFNKFQQLTTSGSYPFKGTGLGLAIVKHIITSHGGRVWAESTLGRGSIFVFLLPS